MSQEDKELLLKDLCARLPYEVKVQFENVAINIIAVNSYGKVYLDTANYTLPLDVIKPYLRPISSMTEEERDELMRLCSLEMVVDEEDIRHGVRVIDEFQGRLFLLCTDVRAIDYLNTHHFDYRCLIERGLALEAPEGMYKQKRL